MPAQTAAQVLAEATAALVEVRDVADVLIRLLRGGAGALGVDAIGLIVRTETGELELLSSTSHRVTELEAYQVQLSEGPCVEAHRSMSPVVSLGPDMLRLRWGAVGVAISNAGFGAVHAFPLSWRGLAVGALNVFTREAVALDEAQLQTAQALADMATVVIVQNQPLDQTDVAEHVRQALAGRTLIEQAKQVLVRTNGLEPADAYEDLLEEASLRGRSLTRAAQVVLQRAGVPGVLG